MGCSHADSRHLGAGEAKLSLNVDNESADVKAAIEKYGPSERLSDDYVDTPQTHSEQIRFLHNSALVSLVSRLCEALRNMADHATLVVRRGGTPQYRNGKFGKKGDFIELFNEYHSRSGMFDSDTTPIDFVGPMVAARNRIAHHGSRAYKMNAGLVDETSANHFKQYVKGSGWEAVVEVTDNFSRLYSVLCTSRNATKYAVPTV